MKLPRKAKEAIKARVLLLEVRCNNGPLFKLCLHEPPHLFLPMCLLLSQEDVRNIEAGKILLPKYLHSAEPPCHPSGVRHCLPTGAHGLYPCMLLKEKRRKKYSTATCSPFHLI